MRPRRRQSIRRLAGRAVLDVSPLRESVPLRWLLLGQLGTQLGRQTLVVAVPYQVFVETRSPLLVGAVGLVQVVPLVLGSFLGGVAADTIDRHRLLSLIQLGMGGVAAGLAINAATGATAVVFVLMVAHGLLFGMESPTRTSIIPAFVPLTRLPSAYTLNQTLGQTAAIAGPALGGVLIAWLSLTATYAVAAVSFVLGALMVVMLGPSRARRAGGRPRLSSLIEGWQLLRSKPILRDCMLLDLSAMVLSVPRTLFPAIGLVVFGGDARTVGLLYSAMGVGALLCAFTAGWVSHVRHQGRVVVVALLVWSVAITGFGLVDSLPVALTLLALAGAANTASTIFRHTILQLSVPDQLRGRMSAFNSAVTTTGPQLGEARAGAVAEAIGPVGAVVVGGVAAAAAVVLIGVRGRELWAHQAPRG